MIIYAPIVPQQLGGKEQPPGRGVYVDFNTPETAIVALALLPSENDYPFFVISALENLASLLSRPTKLTSRW